MHCRRVQCEGGPQISEKWRWQYWQREKKGEEVVEAAEVDVEVETTPKELIWLMVTPQMHPPTLQYSADSRSVSKQQRMDI